MSYVCKECGARAKDTKDGVIRSCGHDAPLLMDMGSVTLTGKGDASEGNAFLLALTKIGNAILSRWAK